MATSSTAQHPGIVASLDELLSLHRLASGFALDSSRKSQSIMQGSRRSSLRGRGMEYAEVRPYQNGDDVRNIDWRVTARTQETWTKLFQEEKERPVYLVVDQCSSMYFGSHKQFKSVLAVKLAAFLAWAALVNRDRVGCIIFSDSDQCDLRPRGGNRALLEFIRRLLEFNHSLAAEYSAPDKGSRLAKVLTDTVRIARPGSAIFVLSDFYDCDEESEKAISLLNRHCNVQLLRIYDPLELQLPRNTRLSVSDGRQRLQVDTGALHFADTFAQSMTKLDAQLLHISQRHNVPYRAFSTQLSVEECAPLILRHRNSKTR